MEKKSPKPMTPFDELLTPPKLQMLKLFLPYTPTSNQSFLGIFIKFMELEHTISFFQNSRTALHNQAFQNANSSPAEMLQELKPYLPPQQSEMMDTFLNIMNIMEMASSFQEGTEEQAGDFAGGLNPMDMMMGMLTPDQQNMYQMYNSMFSDNMNASDNNPDENNADENSSDENTSDKSNQADKGFVKENSVQYDNAKQKPWQDNASDFAAIIKGDYTHERLDEPPGNEEY